MKLLNIPEKFKANERNIDWSYIRLSLSTTIICGVAVVYFILALCSFLKIFD